MKLKGSIDIVQLENGLNQITFDLKKVEATSKGVNSDFERMNQQANRLSTALGLIGGSAALIGLAKQAPQVALALAMIDLSMFKLGMTLGTIMQPAFNFLADKLNQLADWAAEHPNIVGAITTSILILSGALLAFKVGKAFTGFMAFLTSRTVLGIAATLWGIYNAYKAVKDLTSGTPETKGKDIGTIAGTAVGAVGGGLAGATVGMPVVGAVVGGAAGGFLGGFLGKAIENMINTWKSGHIIPQSTTNKTSSLGTQSLLDVLNQSDMNNLRKLVSLNLTSLN